MDRRLFGPIGREVPVVGLGTWKMEQDDRRAAIGAIRRAVEIGLVHIDTAELYGSGVVESLVGEALDGLREPVFLVSKVLPRNATYAGTLKACEASLRRLRTDHLDVYLLHWREDLPLEPTIKAFEELKSQGKIRAWGVSNFDADDLDEAHRIAGDGAIACNQVLYHLGDRTIEHRVIPWCDQHEVAVVAYSPFGGAGAFRKTKTLDEIAARHGATPRQVALAFLTRVPPVFAIPKSSSASHVDELARARDITLTTTDLAAIDNAFPCGPWRGLPTL